MNGALFDGYFADPFVLRDGESWIAYGTDPTAPRGDRVFEALVSDDLREWSSRGEVLRRPDDSLGSDFWAPEVVLRDNAYWMYYSVGHGIDGHHIRVARADSPLGPFVDVGEPLTPRGSFAIDAHPFQDTNGDWYLFYARDVLTGDRPGTSIAVDRLPSPTAVAGTPVPVIEPFADWQLYERDRLIYGSRYNWHTLEGPSVVFRAGRYWMTYSGGSWEGAGYGVAWASAPHPLGQWTPAPESAPRLLETGGDLLGPGHNSLTTDLDGRDVIVFHSWDPSRSRRQLHTSGVLFDQDGPRLDAPR